MRPSLPCSQTQAFTFILLHERFALDRFAILFSKSRSSDRSLRSSCLGEPAPSVPCTSQRAKPLYTTRLPALSSASGTLFFGPRQVRHIVRIHSGSVLAAGLVFYVASWTMSNVSSSSLGGSRLLFQSPDSIGFSSTHHQQTPLTNRSSKFFTRSQIFFYSACPLKEAQPSGRDESRSLLLKDRLSPGATGSYELSATRSTGHGPSLFVRLPLRDNAS